MHVACLIADDEVAVFILANRAAIVFIARQIGGDVEVFVGAAEGFVRHGGRRGDETSTLLEHAVTEHTAGSGRTGVDHEPAFDVVRGERRVGLDHQGGHSGGHRGGLGSPGNFAVTGAVDARRRIVDEKPAARPQEADHMATGSDDFRFDETFDGWTRRGEGGDAVVGQIGRRVVVGHGADRNHVRHVARHPDGQRFRTAVAGRSDHYDAGLPGPHDRLRHGVVPIKRLRNGAEGEVEHADIEEVFILHQPVEATDDVRVGAATVAVESFDRNQESARGHAAIFAANRGRIQSDARNVGAVAVLVGVDTEGKQAFDPAAGGIVLGQHAGQVVGIGRKAVLPPIASVEHGHTDAEAVDAFGMEAVGTDDRRVVGFGGVVAAARAPRAEFDPGIGVKAQPGATFERLLLGRGEIGRHRVDDRQLVGRFGAHRGERRERFRSGSGLDQHRQGSVTWSGHWVQRRLGRCGGLQRQNQSQDQGGLEKSERERFHSGPPSRTFRELTKSPPDWRPGHLQKSAGKPTDKRPFADRKAGLRFNEARNGPSPSRT